MGRPNVDGHQGKNAVGDHHRISSVSDENELGVAISHPQPCLSSRTIVVAQSGGKRHFALSKISGVAVFRQVQRLKQQRVLRDLRRGRFRERNDGERTGQRGGTSGGDVQQKHDLRHVVLLEKPQHASSTKLNIVGSDCMGARCKVEVVFVVICDLIQFLWKQ